MIAVFAILGCTSWGHCSLTVRVDKTLAPHEPTILGRRLTAAQLLLTTDFAPGTTRLTIEPMWLPDGPLQPRLLLWLAPGLTDAASSKAGWR